MPVNFSVTQQHCRLLVPSGAPQVHGDDYLGNERSDGKSWKVAGEVRAKGCTLFVVTGLK